MTQLYWDVNTILQNIIIMSDQMHNIKVSFCVEDQPSTSILSLKYCIIQKANK